VSGQLKPCPFCGGKARIDIGKNAFEDAEVSCDCCGTQGPNCDDGFGREDNQRLAIAAWNTRTTPSQRLDAQYEEEITAANQMHRDGLITYDTLKQMVNLAARMKRVQGLDAATVERWVPQIGQRVRVTDASEFAGDWARTNLWVSGVSVHGSGDGLDVTVAEEWPVYPRGRHHNGQTDGWRVGAMSCRDQLEPLATDPHQHGGKGA